MPKRLPLTSAPDRLEPAARDRIRAWSESHAPRVALHLGKHWAECRDHHRARGNQYADWEAAFRTWLRRAVLIEEVGWDKAWSQLRPGAKSRVWGQSGAPEGEPTQLGEEISKVVSLFPLDGRKRGA